MKRYKVEVFFWKNTKNKRRMDLVPKWSDYQEETKIVGFDSWDDPKNEVLRMYPGAAFIIVRVINNIELDTNRERFLSEYDTELLEVRPSRIHLNGVFSKKPIVRSFLIFKLYGEMVSEKDIQGDFPIGEWNAISDTHFLVRKKRTLYGYINHSRQPNCEIDFSTMEIRTIKSVRKDEELTLDYRKEALPETYTKTFGSFYL